MPGLLLAAALVATPFAALAVDPPLQINQYAHTAWTARDGAVPGVFFAMAQTPDGYLWAGGSHGLFRFDGLRFVPWQPPPGQSLPDYPYALLVSRDGTLWIGTFNGLVSWNGRRLTAYPQMPNAFVTSLLEARDGTVWAGLLGERGQLCAIRAGKAECSSADGGFGAHVWSLAEDGAGVLWAASEAGLWRWKPGPPRRFEAPGQRFGDLGTTADGQLLVGIRGAGLRRMVGDTLVPYPMKHAARPDVPVSDRELRSNKLLRDRDGGLWIGSDGVGIVHVQDGLADTFTRADGLSGNVACSLFEDREGNIWFASEKGVDRFRKLPITTLSTRQGLPDEITRSVLATRDGSVWVATNDGLARWKDGRPSVYRQGQGLPDAAVQSLYEDAEGRLWASTARGLALLTSDRFVRVDGVPSAEIYSITGDAEDNLWLSTQAGLSRLHKGRFVETIPWAAFGRRQQAKVIVADRGGLWLAFWNDGGVAYFKDGQVQATYAVAQGLGAGHVAGLRIDAGGVVWAATEEGGLSRIANGRVSTLTTANGLPCNAVHWSLEDDDGSLWMYTACGLVRVMRVELAAWIADPRRSVVAKRWGAADGVPLQAVTPAYFNPPVAKGSDGRIWFLSGADVQVVDPARLPFNALPPPVHVTTIVADRKRHAATPGLQLPPLVRDLTIEFNALSLADPKSTRFRYRLHGHDTDWHEAVDMRQATYTNLPPRRYRFHVTAANNSGVWNEQGAQLVFSIEPALHQTAWFRIAGAVLLLGLAWRGVQLWLRMRIRRLQRQFEATLDARVAERTRIARDLHDTLLQRFHGLLLQFQAAINLLPDRPRQSKQVLIAAVDQAAEAITEGRDTVRGLRAAAEQTNDLAAALRALADDLVDEGAHAAAVQVDVQGTPRSLHPLVRDEAFRIAGEALRNAFRHAGARRVAVDICYEPRQLRVAVRDDGKGIDAEVLRSGGRPGHFGLGGMRERAELVGGTLEVRSAPDNGTEVAFSVPGSRAYPRPARSWLLQRKTVPSETGE